MVQSNLEVRSPNSQPIFFQWIQDAPPVKFKSHFLFCTKIQKIPLRKNKILKIKTNICQLFLKEKINFKTSTIKSTPNGVSLGTFAGPNSFLKVPGSGLGWKWDLRPWDPPCT